ncbi:MAG: rhodanese-like domain-containing protein [Hyphomonadaceae bacterium]
MLRIVITALVLMAATPFAMAQPKGASNSASQIDYTGFRDLTAEVEEYRARRLVSLRDMQRMAREPDTIILDARSADAYAAGHIEGAINLPFTDFTAESLAAVLGDADTRVLIYCNNNFSNNQQPVVLKAVQLALNIQTFINLYGYGYRNVYELADIVDFNDPAVHWVRG